MPYVTYPVQRIEDATMGWYPGQKKKRALKKKKDQAYAGMLKAKERFEAAKAKGESLEEDAAMLAQEVESVSQILVARGITIAKQKEIMAGLVKIPGVVKKPVVKAKEAITLKQVVKSR